MNSLRKILFAFMLLVVVPARVNAEVPVAEPREVAEPNYDSEIAGSDNSVLEEVLFYLPNRIFDLLDIFRARVRVGPGFGAQVRVTESASVQVGTYTSVYAGLPGPRMEPMLPSPVGFEHSEEGTSPSYSPTEVGLGAHLGVVGADITIDPVEIFDFLGGFFMYDSREDDF